MIETYLSVSELLLDITCGHSAVLANKASSRELRMNWMGSHNLTGDPNETSNFVSGQLANSRLRIQIEKRDVELLLEHLLTFVLVTSVQSCKMKGLAHERIDTKFAEFTTKGSTFSYR